ncbi:uncharacterized protein [Montipora capricornis]|uniref:uncharacterized protein n=1 Tax=Montipora capricornis TaxID=246305 RepID=UPI0035F19A0F
MTLSPQEPSLFLPDTGSSSELSESNTTNGNDLSSRCDVLNKFLSVSGVEFVPVSKKKFSELQQRTKINHVSKASETIAAVLDVIAPGDAGALWEATKESKLVERKLSIDEDLDSTEELYLQALAETYDLPFGQRHLQLSNGKIVEAPSVIREMVKERTIKQYRQFCEENNFKPFSYATMHRILTYCSASVRKSLRGLDYISAEGSSACTSWRSQIPDHCLAFALSDPKEEAFQNKCDHTHKECCQSCEELKCTLNLVEDSIKSLPEKDDDLLYSYSQAVQAINSWKAHLLRSVQQDKARTDVFNTLDEKSVLITQDWAMKFLPQKYRETQAYWFGKRGISWHVSVVIRKVQDVLQHQTLIHVVQNSSQETDTVTWIMENVLSTLKKDHPELKVAYFRQDNAGCYHSVAMLSSCPQISLRTGIHIKRVDFSDPQGGKGACDRKAATVKGHVRRYINEGHDVETAEEFKNAVLSHCGINGVRVALVDTVKCGISVEGKWDDISSLNNFSFDEREKVTVWKSHDVGRGKEIPWNKLPVHVQVLREVETCTHFFSSGDFVEVQVVKEKNQGGNNDDSRNDDEIGEEEQLESSSELFSCPIQGCTLSFKRHSNLENHISYGKCRLRKEKLTVLDQAKVLYAQKLSEGTTEQPSMQSVTAGKLSETSLSQGWAIRQTKKAARFNENQRSYLGEKFLIGQSTGIKADPSQVARDLRNARTESGKQRFSIDEFLTPQQIKSYFSRKAAKTKQVVADEEATELAQKDHQTYSLARETIM